MARAKKAVQEPTSGIASRRAQARGGDNPAYRERRAEILHAAARVFKRKGLAGANLGDIAAEAGSDRASLYYYVGSKEELFHEVVREAVEANIAWARKFRISDEPAPQKLRQMIISVMQSYSENYPILYVFVQENLSRMPEKYAKWSQEMRESNREFEQIFVEVIEEGIREGSIRDTGSPTTIAYGVLGMLGWSYRWFNPETSKYSAEEIATTFADSLLYGLQTGRRPTKRAAASK